MISVSTLYSMGYRICHAKNLGNATTTLKKIKAGQPVLHDEIDAAIRALQYAPLQQSDCVITAKDASK